MAAIASSSLDSAISALRQEHNQPLLNTFVRSPEFFVDVVDEMLREFEWRFHSRLPRLSTDSALPPCSSKLAEELKTDKVGAMEFIAAARQVGNALDDAKALNSLLRSFDGNAITHIVATACGFLEVIDFDPDNSEGAKVILEYMLVGNRARIALQKQIARFRRLVAAKEANAATNTASEKARHSRIVVPTNKDVARVVNSVADGMPETPVVDRLEPIERNIAAIQRQLKQDRPLTPTKVKRKQRLDFCCPRYCEKNPQPAWSAIWVEYTKAHPEDRCSPDDLGNAHRRHCPACKEQKR